MVAFSMGPWRVHPRGWERLTSKGVAMHLSPFNTVHSTCMPICTGLEHRKLNVFHKADDVSDNTTWFLFPDFFFAKGFGTEEKPFERKQRMMIELYVHSLLEWNWCDSRKEFMR